MPFIAEVILPVYLKNTFHYLIPEDLVPFLEVGKRVLVPFGRSNKIYTGMIIKIYENSENIHNLKPIHQIVDEFPVISNKQLEFWKWIANYYCCSLGEVMLFALPNHLIIYTHVDVVLTEEVFSLDNQALSEKELAIVNFLLVHEKVSYEKLKNIFSEYSIKKLIQKQIFRLEKRIINPYKPKFKTFVFLNVPISSSSSLIFSEWIQSAIQNVKSENHQKVLLYLVQNNGVEKQFLINQLGITDSVLKTLEKKSLIRLEKHAVDRVQLKTSSFIHQELDIKEKNFCNEVIQKIQLVNPWKPIVFFHDLGNKRIQFYIEWFKQWIEQGKQILFLVSEIAFTDKFVLELQNDFYDSLGIYHSKINDDERVEIWYKVFLNEYKIVIGVRSALFLPFSNLGLILIDEEQDPNYKQEEKNPKIHIRDAAIYYAKLLNIPVILASQTPSIETYYQAQSQKYQLIKYLKSSHLQRHQILIKDIKTEVAFHQTVGLLSEQAYKLIYEQKLKGHVSVLFINRKGYAPRIVCNACGHVHFCKHCDIALTYHKQFHKLKCHYCGYQEDNIYFCKHCGSNDLEYEGFGTEKVEEQLYSIFPNFRIVRLDSDNFKSKKQLSEIVQAIHQNEVDIVIGTQLITKVIHLENIELIVLLLADNMLHIPNFRAFEYTYQFIRQLIFDFDLPNQTNKQLIIQTRIPEHKIYQYLWNDYAQYYHEQILLREELHYPPFTRLIELELLHSKQNVLYHSVSNFDKILRKSYHEYILGPSIPSVAKLKDYYRIQYLIKIPKFQNPAKIKDYLQKAFQDFVTIEKDKNYKMIINVDPR